jgi:hypothetical protein
MVGGVTPGKGGTKDPNGLPIFDTVEQAVRDRRQRDHDLRPARLRRRRVLEAATAGIRLICCITEGVPVQDMIKVRAVLDRDEATPPPGATIPRGPAEVHPRRPQLPRHHHARGPKTGDGTAASDPYTNAGCKIGIMPGYIHTHMSQSKLGKAVGIVSRSGTLTYEAVWQTSNLGFAQSTCVGIGGDPVRGLNHIDCIRSSSSDPDTHGILMIGEIGGSDEERPPSTSRASTSRSPSPPSSPDAPRPPASAWATRAPSSAARTTRPTPRSRPSQSREGVSVAQDLPAEVVLGRFFPACRRADPEGHPGHGAGDAQGMYSLSGGFWAGQML